MKILFVHNAYQHPGGEDAVMDAEARLLEAHGHQIVRYERHNRELSGRGLLNAIGAGIQTVHSAKSLREISELVRKERPDVAHFHNTFPLISPAAFHACSKAAVPVVQTLHNYRLMCPAAAFLRNGKICEECLGRAVAWPGIAHGCYRGSRTATAAVAAMVSWHKMIGTWQRDVDLYIALTEFARNKFIAGGLPADRIVVKPNFVEPDPGPKQQFGEYALFVGRLSDEKGLDVLLEAWARLPGEIPLRIVGDGPLRDAIARRIREDGLKNVELSGQVTHSEVIRLLKGARFLVLPSIWYEGFPLVFAEAFACAVPVVASRLGAMEEIIEDARTGLHFTPGDSCDLGGKIQWAWNHSEEMNSFGLEARSQFERKYTAQQNYEDLISIYRRVTRVMRDSKESVPAYRGIAVRPSRRTQDE